MSLTVQWAVYGALPGGSAANAKANDVTHTVNTALQKSTELAINNTTMGGDPAPGNTKHFGALVTRNGVNFYFACQEGQTINFGSAGGVASQSSNIIVLFAVYGALTGGVPGDAAASDVTTILQDVLNQGGNPVLCNNNTFGGDPSPGNTKHFAALVSRQNVQVSFACQEGQTIDFTQGGGD